MFENLEKIGSVIKPHGFQGRLIAELFYYKLPEVEYFVFLKTDGYFVPYQLKMVKPTGDESQFMLKFREINSDEEVKKIIDFEIFAEKQSEEFSQPQNIDIQDLIGFKVVESKNGKIGEITNFENIKNNPLIIIEKPNGEELLLPFNGIEIINIDFSQYNIEIIAPSGLMDL